MDIKGIVCYIAIVLIVSYAIEAAIIVAQLPIAVSYALLAAPAIAAFAASAISRSTSYPAGSLWPIPKAKALRIAVATPLVFAAVYTVASLAGVVRFDWGFNELMAIVTPTEELHVDPAIVPMLPNIFAVMALVLSIVLGPTVYALMMLPSEYGWRGYLLPRLMPLGRWAAYVLTGALWAASLLPLVLFGALEPVADVVRIVGLLIALSVLLGEVWNRSRHLSLTAVCCGCCICQATTVWTFAVVSPTTLLPYAGSFDYVAIAAPVLLAVAVRVFFGRFGGESVSVEESVRDGEARAES